MPTKRSSVIRKSSKKRSVKKSTIELKGGNNGLLQPLPEEEQSYVSPQKKKKVSKSSKTKVIRSSVGGHASSKRVAGKKGKKKTSELPEISGPMSPTQTVPLIKPLPEEPPPPAIPVLTKPTSTFGYGDRDFSLITMGGNSRFTYYGASPEKVKKARTAWAEGGYARKMAKRNRYDIYGNSVNTQRPRYPKDDNGRTITNADQFFTETQAAQAAAEARKKNIAKSQSQPTLLAKIDKKTKTKNGKGRKSKKNEKKTRAEGKSQKRGGKQTKQQKLDEQLLLQMQAEEEAKLAEAEEAAAQLAKQQKKSTKGARGKRGSVAVKSKKRGGGKDGKSNVDPADVFDKAVRYETGKGVSANIKKAIELYKQSAEAGHTPAMCALGRLYLDGVGVKANTGESLKYFQKAAKLENLDAMSSLGMMYASGLGLPQDYAKSLEWFTQAAEKGLVRAQYNVGVIYRDGRGVKPNQKAAAKWFNAAAKEGDVAAMSALGYAYINGEGVKKNEEKGLHWFHEAAEKGHAAAQYNLGLAYRDELMGCKRNLREAVNWLTGAAEQGHVNAQCSLGVAYADGQGVDRDYEQAMQWYTKAAEQGYINAQYNLAVMYENGQGVTTDHNVAYAWYRQAAEQGLPNAQYRVAVMYENGLGVDTDFKEALRWYRMAAEQGYDPAQIVIQRIAAGQSTGELIERSQPDVLFVGSEEENDDVRDEALTEWGHRIVKLRHVLERNEEKGLFDLCDLDSVNQLTIDEAQNGLLPYLESDSSIAGLIEHIYIYTKGQNEEGEEESALQFYEFRLFLNNLKQVFEYAELFDGVDTTGDGQVGFAEFQAVLPKLGENGVKIKKPRDVFNQIDTNQGGVISFDEFCGWALSMDLKVESAASLTELKEEAPREGASFEKLAETIPAGNSSSDRDARDELFITIDKQANHTLSFNEIFPVLAPMCELPANESTMYNKDSLAYNSAYLLKRAFDKTAQEQKVRDNQLNAVQFRLFLMYIKEYLRFLHLFTSLDVDHNGQISYQEFAQLFPHMQQYDDLLQQPQYSTDDVFSDIDKNNTRSITFDEFVDWNIALKWNDTTEKHLKKVADKKSNENFKIEVKEHLTAAIKALPVDLTEKDRDARRKMFSKFDPNGNGYLSLAEVDKGIRDVMHSTELFNAKPAVMRAFQAAKKVDTTHKASKKVSKMARRELDDAYIERTEFRMLLVYLKQYFEFYVEFDAVDGDDRRIDIDEFRSGAFPLLQQHGLVTDQSADDVFAEIDSNGGGFILFEEFTSYAISKHINEKVAQAAEASNEENFEYDHPEEEEFRLTLLMDELPTSIASKDTQRREDMFNGFQSSDEKNPQLSLNEAYAGFNDYFGAVKHFDMKKVVYKAYNASRAASNLKSDDDDAEFNLDDCYIELGEFRVFLRFIQMYFQLYKIFQRVDDNNSGGLSLKEFETCAAEFKARGIKIQSVRKTFDKIPKKSKKTIRFDEFAAWAFKNRLDLQDMDAPEEEKQPEVDWYANVMSLPDQKNDEQNDMRENIFKQWTAADAEKKSKKAKQLTLDVLTAKLASEFQLPPAMEATHTLISKTAFEKTMAVKKKNKDQVEKRELRLFFNTIKEYYQYYSLFIAVDDNNSGQVSPDEFEKIAPQLSMIGVYIPSADAMFKEIDASGGGTISFDEFLAFAVQKDFKVDLALLEEAKKIQRVYWADFAAAMPMGSSDDDKAARDLMFDRMYALSRGRNGPVNVDSDAEKKHVEALTDEDLYYGLNQFYLEPSDDLDLEAVTVRSFQCALQVIERDEKYRLKAIAEEAAEKAKKEAAKEAKKEAKSTDKRKSTKPTNKKKKKKEEAPALVIPTDKVAKMYFGTYLEELQTVFQYKHFFFMIDDNKSGKISEVEFENSFEGFSQLLGDLIGPRTAMQLFDEIDTGKTGMITFEEFSDFAFKLRMKSESRAAMQQACDHVIKHLPTAVNERDRDARRALFIKLDKNNNRSLTLNEVQEGIIDFLEIPDKLTDMVNAQHIIKLAYDAVKVLKVFDHTDGEKEEGAEPNDTIERREFHALMVYIRNYFQYHNIFQKIDTSENNSISFNEFKNAFEAISKLAKLEKDLTARQLFDQIDLNEGGTLVFKEFVAWATKNQIEGVDKTFEYSHPDDADWSVKILKLPTKQTNADKLARKELFTHFDIANNGVLSEEEVEKGLKVFLNYDDSDPSKDIGPVVKKAFEEANKKAQEALDKAKEKNSKEFNDEPEKKINFEVIEPDEFRLLLVFVRQQFEYLALFESLDTGNSGNITFKEFEAAQDLLNECGIKVDDVQKSFDECDTRQEGFLGFDEFFAWAMNLQLQAEIEKERELRNRRGTWDTLVHKLPASKSRTSTAKRKELFKKLDTAGNNVLSYEEAEVGIIEELNCHDFLDVKPIIKAAFDKAKTAGKNPDTDHVVTKAEFRLLLQYLKEYFIFYMIFNKTDDSGDMKIDWKEFSAAVPDLKEAGLTGLDDPWEVFGEIDENEGGMITFDEFFAYFIDKLVQELDEVTFEDPNGWPYHHKNNDTTQPVYYYDEFERVVDARLGPEGHLLDL